MYKKIANRLCLILSPATVLLLLMVMVSVAEAVDFRSEADSFLRGMPKGLQEKQTRAIEEAIEGDVSNLAAVRNARNAKPVLPGDVRCDSIGEHAVLFRSEAYRNDTVPLLVYFHGGGWTIGSINSCSRYCGAMAAGGVAVLAVDYRLAPEYPYPNGLDDCRRAVEMAADSLDTWRCRSVSVGGDSSGGNLAIVTAMSMPAGELESLVVFYPVTKAYADGSESWKEYGKGYGLDSRLMEAFNRAYGGGCDNPQVSPAHASDRELQTLPRMMIVGADRDILRDQGREFADRLSRLGVDVDYRLFPGSVHLFITVGGQTAAFDEAVRYSLEFLKKH